MRDDDITLCHLGFNIAKAERETEIQANAMTDDVWWVAVAFVGNGLLGVQGAELYQTSKVNFTMPTQAPRNATTVASRSIRNAIPYFSPSIGRVNPRRRNANLGRRLGTNPYRWSYFRSPCHPSLSPC